MLVFSDRFAICLLSLTLFTGAGCARSSVPEADAKPAAANIVVWLEETDAGTTILLGQRAGTTSSAEAIEPVCLLTKDGKPLADAMVFMQLVAADGKTTLGEEQAAVYEEQSASYSPGKLLAPVAAESLAVRFRILFAGSDQEWSRDVAVPRP